MPICSTCGEEKEIPKPGYLFQCKNLPDRCGMFGYVSTTALLNERAKTHGDYSVHAKITQELKDRMFDMDGWSNLDDCQREALHMIAHKIGRILAGNPSFKDHWDDIAGYAKLVADRCPT